MSKFYPPLENLFYEVKTGRKLSYTPMQLVEKFEEYIQDLSMRQFETETEYRRQKQKWEGEGNIKDAQVRIVKHNRSPKITDFVVRWLGKSMDWWSKLDSGKHGKEFFNIKNKITEYCYNVKFDGAVSGVFNPNIIARDLGLKENVNIETFKKSKEEEEMTVEQIKEEIKRYEAFIK